MHDDKDLRLTICDRVLILPKEEILARSANKLVPAGKVNLYLRLDLYLRPTIDHRHNEVPYGEVHEKGFKEPKSSHVIEREFYGDVLAKICLTVKIPVIDQKLLLKYYEAMTLPSADLWRQEEDAEIKSLNGNNMLMPMRSPAGQKLLHMKWIYSMKYDTEGNIIKG